MDDWKRIKQEHYRTREAIPYENGIIDFHPGGMKTVRNGENLSYDDYVEIQRQSVSQIRFYFQTIYWNQIVDCRYRGKLQKKTARAVLFQRMMIDGIYPDGLGFYGKEDHVWMDLTGFESYEKGDCLEFSASVYRYLKTGNGRQINLGLEKPADIRQLSDYHVPTDAELVDQQIHQLICEVCRFHDQCFVGTCMADPREVQSRFDWLKSLEPAKFTPLTVLAAYELEGRVLEQIGMRMPDSTDPNYEVFKKIQERSRNNPACCYWPVEQALSHMLYPEKPRLYIF